MGHGPGASPQTTAEVLSGSPPGSALSSAVYKLSMRGKAGLVLEGAISAPPSSHGHNYSGILAISKPAQQHKVSVQFAIDTSEMSGSEPECDTAADNQVAEVQA